MILPVVLYSVFSSCLPYFCSRPQMRPKHSDTCKAPQALFPWHPISDYKPSYIYLAGVLPVIKTQQTFLVKRLACDSSLFSPWRTGDYFLQLSCITDPFKCTNEDSSGTWLNFFFISQSSGEGGRRSLPRDGRMAAPSPSSNLQCSSNLAQLDEDDLWNRSMNESQRQSVVCTKACHSLDYTASGLCIFYLVVFFFNLWHELLSDCIFALFLLLSF